MRLPFITRPLLLVAIFLVFLAVKAAATTYYVDVNSTNPTPPYTSWTTASTDIQSAVNETTNGDLVLVNDGVYDTGGETISGYALTNRVVINDAITVQSVDGPAVTIIEGYPIIGSNAVRCVYITNTAALIGFTLTNGATLTTGDRFEEQSGGGVFCWPAPAFVSNCVIIANSAYGQIQNYGVYAGGGGGTYDAALYNCRIIGNMAFNGPGGGTYGGTLSHCSLMGNSTPYAAGAIFQGAVVDDCIISNNISGDLGGGAWDSNLTNCLVIANSGSEGGGVDSCAADNCTIIGNSATFGGGDALGALNNCIIYYNSASSGGQDCFYDTPNYCCTSTTNIQYGNVNSTSITNAPQFVNITNDFHLQSNSPCINMGNNTYISETNDFDGNPRIICGTVDMGAFEYQTSIPMTVAIGAEITNITLDFPLQLQAMVGQGYASSIFWDFGDGTTATNQLSLSHTWPSLGVYTVTLTVSNSFVPQATIASLAINVGSNMAPQLVYYVNANGTNPVPPYSSWGTSATNIQDAIDIAQNGDLVLVTNGFYQYGGEKVNAYTSNRVAITEAITVKSVNGPNDTFIEGYQIPLYTNGLAAMRCVYMTNNAALIGFTLTNGATSFSDNGGGVWCASSNTCIISDCVIEANSAYFLGGGVYQGNIVDCIIRNNSAANGGGAAYSLISRSQVFGNVASSLSVGSGGFYSYYAEGGGVLNCTVFSSAITENSASSPYGEGLGGGAYGGMLVNCDVTWNSATTYGGGTESSVLTNCIVYYNQIFSNEPNSTNHDSGSLSYCCTTPKIGTGCITNDPQLASLSHISLNSPCRGAGNPAASIGVDIDGNPWSSPPSIGCSELNPGSDYGSPPNNIVPVIASLPPGVPGYFEANLTNYAPGFPGYFQANISGPVYTTVWNFGDGTMVTNQALLSHTWAVAGNYPITLTTYNDSYPTGLVTTLEVNVAVPAVSYVDLNSSTPMAPYLSWATAAVDIQDAVNAAAAGSLVLVTNGNGIAQSYLTNKFIGVYQLGGMITQGTISNDLAITKPLTVQSVNGPSVTYIEGLGRYYNFRCAWLTNGATLSGFTLTNGSAFGSGLDSEGGGILAQSTNALITNCVISACESSYGAVYSGTFYNCLIASNANVGAYTSVLNNCEFIKNLGSAAAYSILNNCLLTNNAGSAAYVCISSNCTFVKNSGGTGAAAYGGVLNNCLLVGNSTTGDGGAAAGGVPDNGNYPIVLNNCVISNNAAILGGGVYAQNSGQFNFTNCTLNNCLLAFNKATENGGGALYSDLNNCIISNNYATGTSPSYGGGVEGGLLNNCILIGNVASYGGGADGGHQANDPVLNNCTLVANHASAFGGGASDGSILNQCTIMDNTCSNGDGGGLSSCIANNSLIISNSALGSPLNEGSGGGAGGGSLTNCILAYNFAQNVAGGAYGCTLVNCTVTTNTAGAFGGDYGSKIYNSIVYGNYNTSGSLSNWVADTLNYCCTYPMPTSGFGNITNDPTFVNLAAGNFHLQSSSPCINSGNNAYVTAATDFDGNPRIAGGTVDIGAYEYQTPTSVISYAYLQKYGLPTDGSVDFADLDGSPYNVYQDWIAGLNPTNPASLLMMLSPTVTNSVAGVTVSWESASGIDYNLLRTTNVTSAFTAIRSNIVGQAGTTSYTDTSATNGGPYFYRVTVP